VICGVIITALLAANIVVWWPQEPAIDEKIREGQIELLKEVLQELQEDVTTKD